MKKIILFAIFLICACVVKAQSPTGVPQLFNGKWYKFNQFLGVDSALLVNNKDTNWLPRQPALVFWQNNGYDTAFWYHNGKRWNRIGGYIDTVYWNIKINKKQDLITLTTTGTTGPSTLIGGALNIPNYGSALTGYVPYVGATANVDLGAYQLNANTLKSDFLLQIKNTPYSITPTSDYTSITPDKSGFVFYTSWLQGSTTYTQSNRFMYANPSLQNNTRQYNLPIRDGTLALLEDQIDTTSLSNRINLKADKATTLTINGVTYNLSANRTWTIPGTDTTSLSNRINLKLNISDTAAMLSPYLRKVDTASLSNRINLKADKATTLTINGDTYDLSANRSWTIPTTDTTSLSNRINLKLNISDTAAMLSPYQIAINARVKYTDTASMLAPYLRKLDTASLSNRINLKQDILSLTTTGNSGPATLTGATLNIPQYQGLLTNPITGTGTINTVAKFTSTTAIGNSNIKDDGNVVTVSTTAGSFGALQVGSYNGNILMNTTNSAAGLIFQNTSSSNKLWDISSYNNDLNFNESNIAPPRVILKAGGDVIVSNLAGSGTRMVVADASGALSSQAIIDTTSLSNRINTKLNISDTASMLSPYLKSAVTSVGLSMPSAFTVTNSPVTSTGTLTVTGAGNTSQYIDGTGALQTMQGIVTEVETLVKEVYNETGSTLTKGTVVYINGGHGNLPTVTKAAASSDSLSAQTFGLVKADISDNSNGYVIVIGDLIDMPTNSYTEGTQLYLSPTAGLFTSTKQYAPSHLVYVGIVTRSHPTQGIISVKIQNGYEMDELHNVSAQSPSNNSLLQYKTSTNLWTKVDGTTSNIAEGTNLYYTDARVSNKMNYTDTVSLSNRINAKADALSGTTNTVPKFTSSTTIGNSNIKDNGNSVTVNATAGSFGALQVGSYNGNILMNTTNSNGGLIFQNTSSSNKLWDFSSDNNDLVFNESNIAPVIKLKAGGNVQVYNLSGTGTRMVVADASGVLSSQAISSDTTSLSNRINLKLNISDTAAMLSGYQSAINSKQAQINGTGFVKASGTTISYDNSTYYLASNPNNYGTGTVTSVATGLGLSGGTITTSGTLLVDTASTSILSRQRAANTYYLASNPNGYTSNTGTVTSVAALTLGTSGTDLSSTVANGTTTPVITLNVPTASATNRGALSSADWATFNNKQAALTNPVTGTGTNGYHAKFTATGSIIGNSVLYDNGTNVGLSVIPSAWSAFSALQLANGVHLASYTSGVNILDFGINYYFNGSAYILNTTDAASSYQMRNGEHRFNVAPSGTAGTSANFTQVMTLFNSGNLLLTSGTVTDAGYKLDVNGTGRTLDFSIKNSANAETIDLFLSPSTSNGFIDYPSGRSFTIRNKGSLGSLTLASTGAATFSSSVKIGGGVGSGTMLTVANATNSRELQTGYSTGAGYNYFQVYDGASFQPLNINNLLHINGSSNVLINTITDNGSGAKLQVSGASTFSNSVTAGEGLIINKSNGTSVQVASFFTGGMTEGQHMYLSYGKSAAAAEGFYQVYNQSTTASSRYIAWQNNQVGPGSQSLVLTASGNVGIGTTSPSYTLHVNGSVAGTSAYNNLSDKRFKKDIKPIENALGKVLLLEGVTYNWNLDTTVIGDKNLDSLNHIGFLAQDIEKILPQVVSTANDKEKTKSVAYSDIVPVLTEAIKELSAQIKELQTEIQTLKNK